MKVILTIVLRLIVLTQTPHHCMQSTAFFYQMSSLFIGGLDPLFSSANSEKKLKSLTCLDNLLETDKSTIKNSAHLITHFSAEINI